VDLERSVIRSQGDATAFAEKSEQIVQMTLIVDLNPHRGSSLSV
jgi:hypothetical protein